MLGFTYRLSSAYCKHSTPRGYWSFAFDVSQPALYEWETLSLHWAARHMVLQSLCIKYCQQVASQSVIWHWASIYLFLIFKINVADRFNSSYVLIRPKVLVFLLQDEADHHHYLNWEIWFIFYIYLKDNEPSVPNRSHADISVSLIMYDWLYFQHLLSGKTAVSTTGSKVK